MLDVTKVSLKDQTEDEVENEAIEAVRKEEWYSPFIEELRAEIVETEFTINNWAIKLNWSVGKQITEKIPDFERSKVYGKHIIEIIAVDLKRSPSTLYKAMQFFWVAPIFEEWVAKQPKIMRWFHIVKDLPRLVEGKKEGKEVIVDISRSEKIESSLSTKEEETGHVSPEIHLAWNKVLELWDIKIDKKDFPVINLLGFKKEIEDFFSE